MPGRASEEPIPCHAGLVEELIIVPPPPHCTMSHDEDSVAAQLSGIDLGNLYGTIDKTK